MRIISASEFRSHQRKYLDLARCETIFIKSRTSSKPIALVEVDEDDILSATEMDSIRQGLEDVKAGRTFQMLPNEGLTNFLERMTEEGNV